jgi:hypothetical protein
LARHKAQPRHELPDVFESELAPIQATAAEEGEPVLQIMRIRLDRVRRPLDIAQMRQIPLDRRDRHIVVTKDGP